MLQTVKVFRIIMRTYKSMPLSWITCYVLHVDSDIVMIEYKSQGAYKDVSYIYGTIMSRLPKSYKCVDVI